MNNSSERKIRTYKVTDDAYFKAQSEMSSRGTPLATMLEKVVVAISEGRKVIIHKPKR